MLFLRQIWTLFVKNVLLVYARAWPSTFLRAFILPVFLTAFLSFARNLFIPPAQFGVGEPTAIRSLSNAFNAVSGGRDKVVFVNNGFTGGDIDTVIAQVSDQVRSTGKKAETVSSPAELADTCRSTLRGTSNCIAAAVFYSSPNEGPGKYWNYTLQADAGLSDGKIRVKKGDNAAEIYTIPFQHALDWAIASVNNNDKGGAPREQVMEYPYTSKTQEERNRDIRKRYMGAIIDTLAIAFLIGIAAVTYQLTGLIASEREIGMTQLIDCMMPNRAQWQRQAVRSIAAHLALDAIYLPGWIVMGIILALGVFSESSIAIQIIFQILAGLSFSSFSLFGASFFRKTQLSGITVTVASLLLGLVVQLVVLKSNGAVAILSLIFPSMNFIHFTIFMARWEQKGFATNMLKAAPDSPWTLPGIVFWIFFIIQIIVYPVLGAWVERLLYGTQSKDRKITRSDNNSIAVSLNGFTKIYKPSGFRTALRRLFGGRKREDVLAVDRLDLDVGRGEIMVLLGANGSGKSTTLEAISGLSKASAGQISVNYREGAGGFGLCPQRNVLWDTLTVREHVQIFNRLKSTGPIDSKDTIADLVAACDLDKKIGAASRTLSGGQKRKLQLAMMFTGDSSVCCVDEVSSGLDPISRRKIWDILLSERGRRTILMTTHFLDEADLLADHIAILSKGCLKALGSSVELKNRLGAGYRIHVFRNPGSEKHSTPDIQGVPCEQQYDRTVYKVPDSTQAANFVGRLEKLGISDYCVSGPTIEDVFLKVAEEVQGSATIYDKGAAIDETKEDEKAPDLLTGKRIGMVRQTWVLFCKRFTILRRNVLPYLAALVLPIIAAGLVTIFLKDYERPACSGAQITRTFDPKSLMSQRDLDVVIGPSNKLSLSALGGSAKSVPGGGDLAPLLKNVHFVESYEEFKNYIGQNFRNVTPGGFFLGDTPTFAWKGNGPGFGIMFPAIIQNAMDSMLTNVSISMQYQDFDIPWPGSTGKALQLATYMGLVLGLYPGFFALYLNVERIRNVRALHYSNGVRSFPLWLAYLCFDFLISLGVSVLVTVIFRIASNTWYHLGYLFVVLVLYGIAGTLLAYVVSLFAKSQLAAFALTVAFEAIGFLLYFIAYLSILTYAPAASIDRLLKVMHFVISAIFPIGNVAKSFFTTLNLFSTLCKDKEVISYPGDINLYGGPILFLILQSFMLFGLLIWWDSGSPSLFSRSHKQVKEEDHEEDMDASREINNEISRVSTSNDGLRVLHVTKSFKKFTAVQDVTFGVAKGEVFALLGPNGAGKSTTISLIRGDIQPSRKGGDILVEDISVIRQRAAARAHLGVCPQFDAMDQMTVVEHLQFYARIRGISDVDHNVNEVIRAVGLGQFRNRMAAKLSGGNKRKLSLGIALMGNPSVLLLDEPSSGMDAASKRVMWRTLASVVAGRSLVLTTHSMEEADALANRAGIMAQRMLALGTTDYLRRRHGNEYHVHIVHKSAPHTSDEEMESIRDWVTECLPGAVIEQKTYHGQLRFSIQGADPQIGISETKDPDVISGSEQPPSSAGSTSSSKGISRPGIRVGKLFSLLESNKQQLGIEFYSVSQTTLDQVFLSIVGKHNVSEEGEQKTSKSKKRRFVLPSWFGRKQS